MVKEVTLVRAEQCWVGAAWVDKIVGSVILERARLLGIVVMAIVESCLGCALLTTTFLSNSRHDLTCSVIKEMKYYDIK